jgi:hypothetical protein
VVLTSLLHIVWHNPGLPASSQGSLYPGRKIAKIEKKSWAFYGNIKNIGGKLLAGNI